MHETYVRPRSTSWGSVLGGWLAALGALAILLPVAAIAAGLAPAAQARIDDPTLAFPLIVALFVSWLVGGYVAGRMAGYRRSWHGLMSAIWGLFIALVVGLVAGSSAANFGEATASFPRLDMSAYGNATVFGFVLGIAGVILGGWLGGVLSPSPLAAVVERPPEARGPVVAREAVRERRVRHEPTFWDRMTGRAPEVHEEEGTEALVPPAKSAPGDGEVRRPEEAARREDELRR